MGKGKELPDNVVEIPLDGEVGDGQAVGLKADEVEPQLILTGQRSHCHVPCIHLQGSLHMHTMSSVQPILYQATLPLSLLSMDSQSCN